MTRLNVGCGPVTIPGEIGIDREATAAVQVRADVLALPFRSGCAELVRLDHVLEHLEQRLAVPALLEARRVLRSGGTVRVGVPDLAATCRAYVVAPTLYERTLLTRNLYGSQVHPGEYHRSGWDTETLVDLLVAAGFRDVVVGDDPRDEGICIAAEGAKP